MDNRTWKGCSMIDFVDVSKNVARKLDAVREEWLKNAIQTEEGREVNPEECNKLGYVIVQPSYHNQNIFAGIEYRLYKGKKLVSSTTIRV